jgi:hypothetical protein
VHSSIDRAFDQAGSFKHLNMSRDGRQRHIERSGEFGHHGRSFGQTHEQRAPGSVRKSAKNPVELIFRGRTSCIDT